MCIRDRDNTVIRPPGSKTWTRCALPPRYLLPGHTASFIGREEIESVLAYFRGAIDEIVTSTELGILQKRRKQVWDLPLAPKASRAREKPCYRPSKSQQNPLAGNPAFSALAL